MVSLTQFIIQSELTAIEAIKIKAMPAEIKVKAEANMKVRQRKRQEEKEGEESTKLRSTGINTF